MHFAPTDTTKGALWFKYIEHVMGHEPSLPEFWPPEELELFERLLGIVLMEQTTNLTEAHEHALRYLPYTETFFVLLR